MDIKAFANEIASRHGTRDPFLIARDLDCIVLHVPLNGLRGFYRYMKRCHVIFINEELDEVQSKLVCAHELGHMLMHRGLNRLFLDTCTFMISGKYELDAHRFSVDLIYGDDRLAPYLDRPISDAAAFMGVSESLASYRMQSVPHDPVALTP